MLTNLTQTESTSILMNRHYRGIWVVVSPDLPRATQDAMLFEFSNFILSENAGMVPPITRVELHSPASPEEPPLMVVVFESCTRVLTYTQDFVVGQMA